MRRVVVLLGVQVHELLAVREIERAHAAPGAAPVQVNLHERLDQLAAHLPDGAEHVLDPGARLGNALVAPVVAYVPEGHIEPPTEHMRFAGTISVPEAAFKSILDAAGRGFKRHGFLNIVLLGDSGNYQTALKAVADGLNRDWGESPARAHFVVDYYRATQTTYVQGLRAKGLTDSQIGTHAGSADTSLLLAVDPSMVRIDQLAVAAREGTATGTRGDPRASTAAMGQMGVDAVVSQTVTAIRSAVAVPR